MNWTGLFNLLASGAAIGGAAFVATLQTGATPKQAGVAAAVAVLGALTNHLRQPPTVTAPATPPAPPAQ